MNRITRSGFDARRRARRWLAPGRVELFDGEGNLLGVVLMARTERVVGAGAETVYLQRERQPERLRQSA